MRKLALICGVAAVMAATTFAQGRDLSGTWSFDSAKTGPIAGAQPGAAGPGKMFIKQTPKEMSIAMGREDNTMTFNLDGSDTPQKQGSSKMAWKGDRFVATMTGSRGSSSLTFYREGAWLVVEEPAHGNGIEKLYFAKAGAAK